MVVRGRHQLKNDKPYANEIARVLISAAKFCSEYIGATLLDSNVADINPHNPGKKQTLRSIASDLAHWYEKDLVSGVREALDGVRKS